MVIFIPVLENKYAVHNNNNYCNNDNECWIKFTALASFCFKKKKRFITMNLVLP